MQRKDLLVAAGVTAVLGLGWYQFVWSSQNASETKARAAVDVATNAATGLKTQVATLERTKSELEAKADLAQRLDRAIPDTPELSTLIKQIQTLAAERRVTLAQIGNGPLTVKQVTVPTAPPTTAAAEGGASTPTTRPVAAPTAPTEMTLTLAMTGEYQDLLTFVDALSTLPRLVVVEALTLNQAQSAAEPGAAVAVGKALSATLTARVFTTATPSKEDPNGTPTATTAPAAPTATTAAGATGGPTTTLQGGL